MSHTNDPREAPSLTLVHRPLSRDEARLLHEELKTTPNIFGYTVPELLRFPDVFVAEAGGRFAGACISKDLLFRWTDIAVLYVLPAFRGRGLASRLYAAASERASERGRHIYTLSRSPEVIHLMERSGMTLTPAVWRSPLAVHLHMNRHMMSWYRIKEARRKATMGREGSTTLMAGTKRRQRPPNPQ